jgi:hypothetical protein
VTTATQPQDVPVAEPSQGVVAVYETMAAATESVRDLARAGIPAERLSVLTQNLESQTTIHGFVSTGDVASRGAATGAGVGALFSLLAGAAFLIIPGVGPVLAAGAFVPPLLGVIEGAVGGAALGGVVGAAMGHFVGQHHIPKLEQELRAGKYLVLVNGDSRLIDRARRMLAGSGAAEVFAHDDAA